GALLLGAMPRVMRRGCPVDAVVLGIAVAILANSRPYEGLVLSLVVFGALLWHAARSERIRRRLVSWAVVLPLSLVIAVAGAATCFYFWRVTGSPLRMPIQVNRKMYAVAPYFYGQIPHQQPVYRNAAMQDFYSSIEFGQYLRTQSALGFLKETSMK